jgi:hypothetical protein
MVKFAFVTEGSDAKLQLSVCLQSAARLAWVVLQATWHGVVHVSRRRST